MRVVDPADAYIEQVVCESGSCRWGGSECDDLVRGAGSQRLVQLGEATGDDSPHGVLGFHASGAALLEVALCETASDGALIADHEQHAAILRHLGESLTDRVAFSEAVDVVVEEHHPGHLDAVGVVLQLRQDHRRKLERRGHIRPENVGNFHWSSRPFTAGHLGRTASRLNGNDSHSYNHISASGRKRWGSAGRSTALCDRSGASYRARSRRPAATGRSDESDQLGDSLGVWVVVEAGLCPAGCVAVVMGVSDRQVRATLKQFPQIAG